MSAWSRARSVLSLFVSKGLVFVVGAIVFSRALLSPYWLDDFVHRAMARGTFPSPRSPFDLYNFVTDGDRQLLVDRGVLPWWTHPHLTIRFFRPLSSALRWIDFRLSDDPFRHHLHSLAWWVLAVVAARTLFRRRLSTRASWIATFVFALAPCHVVPMAWLANREALVSVTLGAAALAALVRFHSAKETKWRHAILALVGFSIGMLAGEYTLAFGGYVVALAWFFRAPAAKRAVSLATFAIPAIALLVARAKLGFGNAGSGFYRDPFTQTGAFLSSAPSRFACLFSDAWLGTELDEWLMSLPSFAVIGFFALVIVLVVIPVRRLLAAQEDASRAMTKTWIAGSALALVPMTSVLPSPRLLAVAMLGVAPVVAQVVERAWFPPEPVDASRADATGVAALLLAFLHMVHAPVYSYLQAGTFRDTSTIFGFSALWLRDRVQYDAPNTKIVVARAGWQALAFAPFAIDFDGRMPKRWMVLSLAPHVLMVRTGPRAVDIVVPKGRGYFPTGPNDLFRSADLPLKAGEEVRVPGFKATVLAAGTDGPGRVHFDFDDKLESMVWIADSWAGWHDASLPQVGFGTPLDH